MRKEDLKKYKLPDEPGVYIFKNAKRQRIYIGKATSLKSRVASYFGAGLMSSRGPLLVKMLEEAMTIEYEETDSVLEALILEANLIKKYQPIYNSKEKSNKSFNYLVITDEDYPRLLIKRARELLSMVNGQRDPLTKSKKQGLTPMLEYKYVFGPFPLGTGLKEALKVVRKIFPYRDKCKLDNKKGCFSYQIGLCPGACTGAVSEKEYKKTVRHIVLLFEGKKKKLLEQLSIQMRKAAKAEKFEEAVKLRNQVYALEHINDIALMEGGNSTKSGNTQRRIEAYDVAHMGEQNRVGVMVVLEAGETSKSEYKKFKIKTTEQGDIAALKELLTRRLAHSEWELPSLIVVDGGKAQVNAARKMLQHNCRGRTSTIPVVGVVKNKNHKPKAILGDKAISKIHEKEILLVNNEAHRFAINYHKNIRSKSMLK
jgi:excinuclease ABC subunit C